MRTRANRRRVGLLALLLTTGLLAACARKPATPEQAGPAAPPPPAVVKIGSIYPLSGPLASVGADSKNALELATQIINDPVTDLDLPLAAEAGLPNLGGAKVEFVVGDHQGDPNVGAAETERLITQVKVVAVTGSYHSSVSNTATQVAERLGVPFLISTSSSPTLTARGFKWTFRTWPHDGYFIRALVDFMADLAQKKGFEVKTAAILAEDTLFGQDSAKLFKELVEARGVQVVENIAYRANTTSLDAEVQRLKAANPDVLFTASYISDAILTVKTMQKLNYVPRLLLANDAGYSHPDFLKAVGKEAYGMTTRSVTNADLAGLKPSLATVINLYEQRFGRTMSDIAMGSFTAALVIADAINRAGSTDPEAIQKALLATDLGPDDVILPWQGVRFDPESHQNVLVQPVVLQVQEGKFVTVWPFSVAQAEAVYPIPGWADRP